MIRMNKYIGIAVLLTSFLSTHAFTVPPLSDLADTPKGYYQRLRNCKRPDECNLQLPRDYTVQGIRTTKVKNQNPLGTCASFAVSACCEVLTGRALSEAEFTIFAETHMRDGDCKSGMYLGRALRFAQEYGLVKERDLLYLRYLKGVARLNQINPTASDWLDQLSQLPLESVSICKYKDYDGTMDAIGSSLHISKTPDHNITDYRIGKLYEIRSDGYQGTDVLQKIKDQLWRDRPVATALPVFGIKNKYGETLKTNWDQNVRDKKEYEDVISSHAVVIAGYDDDNRRFLLKNSWGTDWGNDGYAWISYDYIARYASEIIAVGRQKQ